MNAMEKETIKILGSVAHPFLDAYYATHKDTKEIVYHKMKFRQEPDSNIG